MFTELVAELKNAVAAGELHVNSALDKLHAEFMAFVNRVQMPAVTEAPPVVNAIASTPVPESEQPVTQDTPEHVDPQV